MSREAVHTASPPLGPDVETPALAEDLAFQSKSLQEVSRTFALTIPQLSEGLRDVVGNAYLLCRIIDTVEDSPSLTLEQKQRYASEFVSVVNGDSPASTFARDLAADLGNGSTRSERDLIENTPRVIRLTHSFDREEQTALQRCVRIMAGGMEEFQEGQFTSGLRDMAHLDAYCYHVAGVVGEMLCALFCAHAPAVDRRREGLERLAVSFGQGLQMTNILKDIWEDKQRNVCWLPKDVFDKHGFDLQSMNSDTRDDGYRKGIEELVAVAHGHLRNALEYTLLIPTTEPGIRRFCLWALFMAVLTLRRIQANPHFRSGDEVKISRRSVRLVVALTSAACKNNTMLRLLFTLASRGLPRTQS